MISVVWQGLVIVSAFCVMGMMFIVSVVLIDYLKDKFIKWANRERSV